MDWLHAHVHLYVRQFADAEHGNNALSQTSGCDASFQQPKAQASGGLVAISAHCCWGVQQELLHDSGRL